jgi:hypothetical protein
VPREEGHRVRIEVGEEEPHWVEKDAAPGEEGRRARGFFVGEEEQPHRGKSDEETGLDPPPRHLAPPPLLATR